MSIAFSKESSRRVRSRPSSFNFEYPPFSIRSSNSCLYLLHHLSATYILPSVLHLITCFRRQFLRKLWPIQLAFSLSVVCRIFLSSFTLCNISSSFLHDRFNWSPSFSSSTFQYYPEIFYLLSEVSDIQHLAKLCSKSVSVCVCVCVCVCVYGEGMGQERPLE